VAGAVLRDGAPQAEGGYVDIDGEPFYRIIDYDSMPPFLMTVVSASDHWLFVSSTGALTAGRRGPDHALFPYDNDDRIHDSQDRTGGKTLLRVRWAGASPTGGVAPAHTALWEPFSTRYEGLYKVTRSLFKSVYGTRVIFEESNHDLGLSFSCGWATSERFGFVRRCALLNLSAAAVEVHILDGLQNIMPSGLGRRFQMELSTLADGYKENELDDATGMGLYRLSSVPADRPEPNESLRANVVWSEGIEPVSRLLCSAQVDSFRRGLRIEQETLVRGRRGAYFVEARVGLPPACSKDWSIVADVDQDRAGVAVVRELVKSAPGPELRRLIDHDVEAGRRDLVRTVAGADGLQLTGDALNTWRHFSNALFNAMRGGVPASGYDISRADFKAFLGRANVMLTRRQAGFLAKLPETLPHAHLLELSREQADPDLERLAHEYLPLSFSRRHGDPTRPWNVFSIDVKGEQGERVLNYEGNWRDIFQNWEALTLSYPGYVESMIFKFVDASTADGYNPYRVMRDGFDWEVLDPHDAWSYIGYWGDHQVIYLLKLLEVSARYHPGALASLLGRRVFTYAHVPYRIRSYEELLRDPRFTIDFDAGLDATIRRRADEMGADGKALPGPDGAPYRANLAEKLIVMMLARLFNYIPEAGLWMNTQRPEWNDANNALVGYGASMVTLYYLRRSLSFVRELFSGAAAREVEVSCEVADALAKVGEALRKYAHLADGAVPDTARRRLLDCLGRAGSDYRATVYERGFSGGRSSLALEDGAAFCEVALRHIDGSIAANKRADGLYHSYNLIALDGDGIKVSHLYEMLEGQVAVLSSGALSGTGAAELLDALRASKLYRADQKSYLLYPDRRLPGFFEKNNIPAEGLARCATLATMVERGDRRLVVRDVTGVAHFNSAFRNTRALAEALEPLGLPDREMAEIMALYEEVFDHRSFTGRSGTFYKYEGLGSIYWHMVSKLLLAVQEVVDHAVLTGEGPTVIGALRGHYSEIRDGIGTHKAPSLYGAVPTDPYSHTPGFAGAQQPGMTGQVKEDLISRFGEMGAAVDDGRLVFRPHLVNREETLAQPKTFHFFDVDGELRALELAAGTMAFTICQVPVVTHCAGPAGLSVTGADGAVHRCEGLSLDAPTSAGIFERTGLVRRLDVFLALEGS
jgi:hypothetical protein